MNYLDIVLQDPQAVRDIAERGIFIGVDQNGAHSVSYHLHDGVGNPIEYAEFLEIARCLTAEDELEIVLAGNPGGSLYGAQTVIAGMQACQAQIDCIVIGNIASAATMIAMFGDNLIMTPNSSMMIHNASYGSFGKASDIEAHVKFSTKELSETVKEYYNKFLTKSELKKLLKGEEFYYDAKECMERFGKIVASRQKKAAKSQKAFWKDQRKVLIKQIEDMDKEVGIGKVTSK